MSFGFGDGLQDFLVGASEGELAELGECAAFRMEARPLVRRGGEAAFSPNYVGGWRSGGRSEFRAPGFERDAIAGDGVFDRAKLLE